MQIHEFLRLASRRVIQYDSIPLLNDFEIEAIFFVFLQCGKRGGSCQCLFLLCVDPDLNKQVLDESGTFELLR